MKNFPPPTGDSLTAAQRNHVDRVKSFLVQNEFDPRRLNPHLAALVNNMAAACASDEDKQRMIDELERYVCWQRLPGYWLTFLFQLALQQSKSVYFVVACRLYAEAQIGANEDLALSSLENAYNVLVQIQSQSDDANWRRASDDLTSRLKLMYRYYRQWYGVHPYTDVNPLTEHLYSEKTRFDLLTAFPELDRPGGNPTPDDYLRVIARCGPDDVYCRVLARRFVGNCYGGASNIEAAREQYRLGLEEAQTAALDTEIGHLLRLYGHALSETGQLQEAVRQFEIAYQHESHPVFSYWRALSAREAGDARLKMAPSSVDLAHPPKELRPALGAYKDGRMMFEAHVGAGVVPVARAVKQQLFRSFTGNALQAAMLLKEPRDILAEMEATGPRYATEIVAEGRAAEGMSAPDYCRFREARATFHGTLAAFNDKSNLDDDFAKYLASVRDNREARRLYMQARIQLTTPISHAQLSDEIADKVLGLRIPGVVFLLFHVTESLTCCNLLDVGTGTLRAGGFFPFGEGDWRPFHEAYNQTLLAPPETSSVPQMCQALEDLLCCYEANLNGFLEPFLGFLKGKHLKIFPRLFMNQAPLHALTVGGKRLIEHCDVSYAQSLGLFLQVHQPRTTPASPMVTAFHDTKEARVYAGAFAELRPVYNKELQVLPDPSWEQVASSLGQSVPRDLFFACHGHYEPDDPAASYLDFGPERIPFSKLFAELDLRGCTCATLGACESGLGRTIVSAEYQGLSIAFFAAGVRYVVSSLWKVNQLTTAILLSRHYQLLRDGKLGVCQALNQAQRDVMRMSQEQVLAWVKAYLPDKAATWEPEIRRRGDPPFGHPYYWAGFYVAGDV